MHYISLSTLFALKNSSTAKFVEFMKGFDRVWQNGTWNCSEKFSLTKGCYKSSRNWTETMVTLYLWMDTWLTSLGHLSAPVRGVSSRWGPNLKIHADHSDDQSDFVKYQLSQHTCSKISTKTAPHHLHIVQNHGECVDHNSSTR